VNSRGTFFLVATPIGHLKDISQRAAEVLAAADVIAAEDTRHTRQLLTHLGLHKRLISVHGHNEAAQISEVEQILDAGKDVAMASDAGTPLISDPGEKLVSALADHGYDVVSVPGPCAAIVALTVSGLPADRFTFVGFLPRTNKHADDAVSELVSTAGTLIFYESPRRLEVLLERLLRHFGDRRAVLCRELTKLHEEVVRGTISTLIERARLGTRGEVVVLVEGAAAVRASQGIDEEAVAEKLRSGARPRDVAREVAQRSGLSSRAAYAKVLAIHKRAGAVDDSEPGVD